MGYNCELFNDPCENFLCENAGTCVRESLPNSDGSYNSSGVKCMCCAGFDGNHCEINIGRNHTLCLPDPCQNGGHCSFSEESYECKCERGYTGANCEYSDLCLSSPCVESNMESCLTTAEGFVCICKTGWGGRTCNADIDECHDPPNPCLNGGLCVNSHGSYSCSCPPKFTGQYCGVGIPQPVNCRSSQMCKNGGTCVDQEGGTMVCECPPGFIGDVCEVLGEYTPAILATVLCGLIYIALVKCEDIPLAFIPGSPYTRANVKMQIMCNRKNAIMREKKRERCPSLN